MPRATDSNAANLEGKNFSLFSILKGIFAAYVITIPLFMLFALILSNTDFPQRLISPAVIVITIASVFTAGLVSTRGVKSKGWMNGGLIGLIYMLVLYLLSSIVYKSFVIDRYAITMAVIGILTGAIGGITGINAKKGMKYKSTVKKR